jgi:hypothetical protein
MEGIMNLPANVGGATSQDGLDSFAPLIAAQSAARDIGYPRFTRELLSAGSEIDQAEVQEFLQEIRNAGIGPEELAVMRRVVEAVFNDPNNYPQVRGQLLAEGVPEDILPETFDLEFFVALRMATEEAENLVREPRSMDQGMPMEAPVGMAEGGIVGLPQMTPIAREMAAMGRNGDTMLAHITPQEAMMLQRMGGSGTINPYTGLPEFFKIKIGNPFKAVGKAFKSVGKAVKKFASSKVGRIITTVALGAFLGPAAAGMLGVSSAAGMAAVGGFVGSFGSGMLAGDGLQNSLRSGLTGAALAGGLSAISGGSAAMQARPEFQTAYGQRGFFGTVRDTTKNFFGSPVDEAKRLYGTDGAAQAGPVPGVGPVGTATEQLASAPPAEAGAFGRFVEPPVDINVQQGLPAGLPQPSAPQLQSPANLGQGLPGGPGYPGGRLAGINVEQGLPSGLPDPASISVDLGQGPSYFDKAVRGAQDVYTGAKDVFTDYLSPNRPGIQGRSANTIFDELTAKGLPKTADTVRLATEMAAKEAPGMLAKYGPLAATGIGALAVTGGLSNPFEVPEQEPGESYEAYMARRDAAVAKFRQERPEFYGSFLGPSNQGTVSMQPSYSSPPIITAATGSGPQGVENFPRKNGAINGPGTGTSDDIPAMLSDGEFVFTAKSVRNMGGGSRRKGAAKMYKLMKMLEGGPVDKTAKA